MSRRRLDRFVVGLVVVGLAPVASALAQTTVSPPPAQTAAPPPRAAGPGQTPNQELNLVQEMLDSLAIQQAQDFLGLTNEQYAAFVPKMRALQLLRRRHHAERQKQIQQMRQLTRPDSPPADDAALLGQVKALDDLELKMDQDERTALAEVDGILSPRQRVRFRIFEERIEQQKVDLLLKVRGVGTPRGGRGPGH